MLIPPHMGSTTIFFSFLFLFILFSLIWIVKVFWHGRPTGLVKVKGSKGEIPNADGVVLGGTVCDSELSVHDDFVAPSPIRLDHDSRFRLISWDFKWTGTKEK